MTSKIFPVLTFHESYLKRGGEGILIGKLHMSYSQAPSVNFLEFDFTLCLVRFFTELH